MIRALSAICLLGNFPGDAPGSRAGTPFRFYNKPDRRMIRALGAIRLLRNF